MNRRGGGRHCRARLAAPTRLTTDGVTRVVDRPESAGLVRRDPDPGDRRRVLVVPPSDRQGLVAALLQLVSTG